MDLLRRVDGLFVPEGAAGQESLRRCHRAPARLRGGEPAPHLELFTIRRTVGRLEFVAGSESGVDVSINDVPPETAAQRLREVRP